MGVDGGAVTRGWRVLGEVFMHKAPSHTCTGAMCTCTYTVTQNDNVWHSMNDTCVYTMSDITVMLTFWCVKQS